MAGDYCDLPEAVVRGNAALCPVCGKKLCRLRKNARAGGVELWCKVCRSPVLLKIL